jgi:hypothetical protein
MSMAKQLSAEDPTSPDPAKLQAQAIARGRREAMRRRASRIRRTVWGTTAGLFVAAFLGVYVQLASGHDPALDAAAKRQSATTTSAAKTKVGETARAEQSGVVSSGSTGSEGSSSSSTESSSGESSSSEEASSTGEASSPAPLTTSQS